eukprot:1339692-Ditylum_brightwellii.AAC.1
MADVGHCWRQQQEPTSSAHIEGAARRHQKKAKIGGGGGDEKLVAAAAKATKSKTVAMAMASQDGDAKPIETGMGSRQQGA